MVLGVGPEGTERCLLVAVTLRNPVFRRSWQDLRDITKVWIFLPWKGSPFHLQLS